ncbi:MAG: hypothetical protein IMZ61_08865 [Planctomycetes bacterium]|nr:hypothetical protein [Planctomycetota bacterium]
MVYGDEKLEGTGIFCYVAPGNDDMFEVDDLIRSSRHIWLAEGNVVQLDDHHEMISSGWTNPTPWHTFREESEDKLLARMETMIAKVKDVHPCIFDLYVPPFDSSLDVVPKALSWNARARIGKRLRWYEEVHEVRR